MKKLKKFLPILCACMLLFGSTLTVLAAETTETVTVNIDDFTHEALPYKLVYPNIGSPSLIYITFTDKPMYYDTYYRCFLYPPNTQYYSANITGLTSGSYSDIDGINGAAFAASPIASNYDILDQNGAVFFSRTATFEAVGSTSPGSGSASDGSDSDNSGILSSIVDWLSGIAEKIANLPALIGDSLKQYFVNIVNAITALPDKIIEGIKGIFVPEEGYIEEKLDYLTEGVNKLGITTFDMSAIMGKETALSDINGTYRGALVTFVDMDVVVFVVAKFRPVIRGLMWLMLIIYNYNQFMGLIGQQSLTLGGIISTSLGANKEEPWADDARVLQQFYKWSK